MDILYCNKWWLKNNEPIGGYIDAETARKKHMAREDYVAVIKENDDIKYIVEFLNKWICVRFINDDGNMYLFYSFKPAEEDNIFLKGACYYGFENGNDEETEMIGFNFSENGEIFMEKNNYITGETIEKESVDDVSCNWDKYPEFGHYENLLVKEREL